MAPARPQTAHCGTSARPQTAHCGTPARPQTAHCGTPARPQTASGNSSGWLGRAPAGDVLVFGARSAELYPTGGGSRL
jgi:hypothetical protein